MKLSFKKVVGIVVLIIAILLVGSVATLWILFPPEKIKALVIPEVEKALARKVSVEKAGITVFPILGVSLSGVQVSNTTRDGFSDEPFIKMDKFLIHIGFMSILKGYPVISKVALEKPNIHVEIDSSGSFNFDDMPVMASDTTQKKKNGLPVLPVPISLKSFVIENGTVTYSDKKAKQEFIIGNIKQKVGFDIDKELKDVRTSGSLILSQISIKTKEIKKPLSNLTVTLNHSVNADLVNGKATVNELKVSLQKVFLNMTGTITDLNTEPNLDLTLKSDPIQIKDLLSEIPVDLFADIAKLSASGTADLGLNIKGVLKKDGAIPVKGNLKLTDVMVKYASLPKSVNNLNMDCNFTDSSVAINSLKMNFGDNPIELHASFVNFKHPFVDLAILAKLKLDDVKDIIELPKGVALSGNAAIDVNAKGEADPSDPTKLDVKGTLDLAEMSVLYPPLVKPARINGRVTLSSKAIGENLSVKIGQSSLTMNSSVSNYLSLVFADSTKNLPRPAADFTLSSSLLNVDEIMPPTQESQKNTGTQSVQNAPLIAPLPGVDVKGSINAQKIIYQGITMDDMKMLITVNHDIADIDIRSGISQGTINEIIHADLRNTSNISFNNKLTVNSVEVNDLITNFLGGFIKPTNMLNRELINLQNSLYGKVNVTSNISGHGGTQDAITKSLNGDITLKIANGKIVNSKILNNLSGKIEKFIKMKDMEFRDLKAIMHVENEKVQFNSFEIFSALGDWNIKGTTGFNGILEMEVNNKLTKETSGKILAVQNKGKDLAKGLLGGSKLSSFTSSFIDNKGIPSDKEGRVTLKMNLGGTLTSPQASFGGFGAGTSQDAATTEATSKKAGSENVKQMISEKKEELGNKVQEEKEKAEAEARKKAEEEKAALDAQLKKQEDQLKKGVNKLKKLF